MWLAGLIGYIIYSDLRTRNAWDAVERGKLLARTLSGRQLTLTSMVFFVYRITVFGLECAFY